MGKRNLYAEVTARIVESLERGVAPWVRPWSEGIDRNAASGRSYSGVNTLLLSLTRQERGYSQPGWLTFRQARALGGHVRRGERGTQVIYWRLTEVDDDGETELDSARRVVPLLRGFTVFNIEQCDGLASCVVERWAPRITEEDRLAGCEAFVHGTGARIVESGDTAAYVPSRDMIEMPAFAKFKTREDYYSTCFHEAVHWTGAKSRCNRDLTGRFGGERYAGEELVAELGSAFLCAEHGIEGKLQHANYIGHWLRLLRGDQHAIFTASKHATMAVEFLRKLQPNANSDAIGA